MTQTSPSARSDQHREVLAPGGPRIIATPPIPGPIAILPVSEQLYADAVTAAGGVVAPLTAETRGLVWLGGAVGEFAAILRAHPQLQWVQLPLAGVDAFADVMVRESRPGLLWTSAKGAFAQPVAEHALTLTLALLRELPVRLAARSWASRSTGESLYGLNVVIIGAGGVAIELLRLLGPFGVVSTIVRRSGEPVPGAGVSVTTDRLDDLLPMADVVVIAAALTDGTRRLFAREQFAAMKDTAYLVNIARGGLVDTDDLVDALRSGAIAGAGLDVTDPEPLPDGHPLWTTPRVIITPHSADTPEMIAPLLARRLRNNVEAFLGRGTFGGVVDPDMGY